MISSIRNYINFKYARSSSLQFICYLRKKGIKIGNGCVFRSPKTTRIDITRPSLVEIGDNCVIAAGSVVNKDIPANCVAAGVPAKVICSLDKYFEKRKVACVEEAFEYARSIKERFDRTPTIADFWEEFPLFLDGNNLPEDTDCIMSQLGGRRIFQFGKENIRNNLKILTNF